MPLCPAHGIPLKPMLKGWYCEECGRNVLDYHEIPRPPEPASQRHASTRARDIGLDLERLPAVVAIPLAEYAAEADPRIRLWHLCDTVELTLRLLVAMGLADVLHSSRGELPAALRGDLVSRIMEPTLGKWRGMAAAVAKHLPQDAVVPEIRGFVTRALAPLLDGSVRPATVESSVTALRNRLAHGGGITSSLASVLLAQHAPRFEEVMRVGAWLGDLELVAPRPGLEPGVLAGPAPGLRAFRPATDGVPEAVRAAGVRDAVMLVRREAVLPLWPLICYGRPAGLDEDVASSRTPVSLVYARRSEVHLLLTPLGSEEITLAAAGKEALQSFLALFGREQRHTKWEVPGFEADLQKDSDQLVGRSTELQAIHRALEQTSDGVLWVTGPAGIGKSFLMARVAVDLRNRALERELILPFRFKVGDPRCSRAVFLQYARERLRSCPPLAEQEEDTHQGRPGGGLLRDVRALLERAVACQMRVVFLLDGLDELAGEDAAFAREIPLGLRAKGVVWLCAGRPERGLPQAFAPERCRHVFPAGLGEMADDDLREMLLEKIGPLRNRLVRRDRDEDGRVVNDFIEQVKSKARGLPIYVRYVIGDALQGRIRTFDERLPPSLEAYYEKLLQRLSVGSLHQVLTPLAMTLAVAREPLTSEALHALLARRTVVTGDAEGLDDVSRGLSAIASMLRRAITPDGTDGFTLFHHSLREHMEKSDESRRAFQTARKAMCDAALTWERMAEGAAGPYIFRQGIAHLVEGARVPEAAALLTHFGYAMARLAALEGDIVTPLLADYELVERALLPRDRPELRPWQTFFRGQAHILRRGNRRWPAHKMLLQLAVEHADDSPVTRRAEEWLEAGHCDWVWLRNTLRPSRAARNPCVAVLEGHVDGVEGAKELSDGRILSWSRDGTLRLWDSNGTPLGVLEGHTCAVVDTKVLSDGRILSRSVDDDLRLWDSNGTPLAILEDYADFDETLRVWDSNGALLAVFEGHRSGGRPQLLSDGRIVSWSADGTLCLWVGNGTPPAVLEGHSDLVAGAKELSDGRILSWSRDRTLRLWDSRLAGHCASRQGTERQAVRRAIVLSAGRILSLSESDLRLWDTNGALLAVLESHADDFHGAIELSDGRILSWSDLRSGGITIENGAGTLRLWDSDGAPLAVLEGHTGWMGGAEELSDGRILSWSDDGTLRLWDRNGAPLAVLEGHTEAVEGAEELSDGRILSDGTLRLRDRNGTQLAVEGHIRWTKGPSELSDGRILSWSRDRTLRLWDSDGAPLAVIEGAIRWTKGPSEPSDRRILCRSDGGRLQLCERSGTPAAVQEGHTEPVEGAEELADAATAEWHSSSDLDVSALLDDGTVVAIHANHLCCLKLYRGSKRIALDDLALR